MCCHAGTKLVINSSYSRSFADAKQLLLSLPETSSQGDSPQGEDRAAPQHYAGLVLKYRQVKGFQRNALSADKIDSTMQGAHLQDVPLAGFDGGNAEYPQARGAIKELGSLHTQEDNYTIFSFTGLI